MTKLYSKSLSQLKKNYSSRATWRLIPLLSAPGAVQMALDRWLLQKHRQADYPSTLRFYTWHPAAISLGYHQRDYPDFWQKLTWQGKPLEIVRRPTGGRAVLHQGDLSYAIATSDLPGKRLAAYKMLCQFLIEGWRSLSVELDYGNATREYIDSPNCFSTATEADLVISKGQKLIGSAQLRTGKAILQHGSIKLSQNPDLASKVFGEPVFSGINRPIEVVVDALTQAAQSCLAINLVSQPLSELEWQEVLSLSQSPKIH